MLINVVAIINAFAASVPENTFTEIQAMGTDEYPATVEGDGIMTTQGDKKEGGVGI